MKRLVWDLERRSHIVSEKDRKLTAYHESGHAIVAHLLPHADPVHKGNNHSLVVQLVATL